MNESTKDRILIVDDDPNILHSFKRVLRRQFDVSTALGGQAGLNFIDSAPAFKVIVSDLRMPEVNGIQLLEYARCNAPDSVRILLTGQADLGDAISVVNKGHIFRFLTKPCPIEIITEALTDGVKQYQLITAERELLDKTLKGSIKLLVELLTLHSPKVFSRASRLRDLACRLGMRINFSELWQVDIAALLSHIGCVTIPENVLQKKLDGEHLTNEESEIFFRHLTVGRDLIKNIPRLEKVAEAIAYQEKRFDGLGLPKDETCGKDIPLIARILKVVLDFDTLRTANVEEKEALQQMRNRTSWYDPEVLAALDAELMMVEDGFVIKDVKISDLTVGMVLAGDLYNTTGAVIVPSRHEISDVLQQKLMALAQQGTLVEPIKVLEYIKSDD